MGQTFDVLIVGGGVLGACLYHHLCQAGLAVVVADQRDFGSGTTQASGMLVWGGLLYLRQGDLPTVYRLCRSRDKLVHSLNGQVRTVDCRLYLADGQEHERHLLSLALQAYWLCALFRYRRPRWDWNASENDLLKIGALAPRHLHYQEAALTDSDARFALSWIMSHEDDCHVPLNHCSVEGGSFSGETGLWRIGLHDRILERRGDVRARLVINAAGVWVDEVNERFGIKSFYRHVISKGVFLGLRRDPRHQSAMFFRVQDSTDVLSLLPWGPVSLWGPTETVVDSPSSGFDVHPEEILWLVNQANSRLASTISPTDIVSIRCGARALAVPNTDRAMNGSLALSRRVVVDRRKAPPWISLYGGKLTDCMTLARNLASELSIKLRDVTSRSTSASTKGHDPTMYSHPAFSVPIVDAQWCAEHEHCWTLDDYLRRRTNVAQWVPRCGLGTSGEFAPLIAGFARHFAGESRDSADAAARDYTALVDSRFDRLIAACLA